VIFLEVIPSGPIILALNVPAVDLNIDKPHCNSTGFIHSFVGHIAVIGTFATSQQVEL